MLMTGCNHEQVWILTITIYLPVPSLSFSSPSSSFPLLFHLGLGCYTVGLFRITTLSRLCLYIRIFVKYYLLSTLLFS
ncbi:hypothetical protein EDB82DRAFT_62172 [Fusarium venenatum]|uniref:uncharacterized protein n=1 Tax=Fusarium venenatum TaxID=56646 RepID=UPI001D872019|nr:hypothetical protein EDB82DRAFT_62172 [Fusarium venenatum]